jgi:hypothetical protein
MVGHERLDRRLHHRPGDHRIGRVAAAFSTFIIVSVTIAVGGDRGLQPGDGVLGPGIDDVTALLGHRTLSIVSS